jgi:hypothetical protein
VAPLRELSEWCDAHLTLLRKSRDMIRKCMAEVDEHPEMATCMRQGPDVVHRQLFDYTTRLAKLRGLALTRDDIHVACMMLQGALFADAMGRDIMPDLYEPVRRAGEGYARFFLRMLGAEQDAVAAAGGDGSRGQNGASHANGARTAADAKRRQGIARRSRPPRGT